MTGSGAARYAALGAWMSLIWWSSATSDLKAVPWVYRLGLLPGGLSPELLDLLELLLRKGAHLLAFGILALLVRAALAGSVTRADRSQVNSWAFALTLLYASIDEIHQSFVPGRAGRVADVLIDGVGALLALGLAARLSRRSRAQVRNAGSR